MLGMSSHLQDHGVHAGLCQNLMATSSLAALDIPACEHSWQHMYRVWGHSLQKQLVRRFISCSKLPVVSIMVRSALCMVSRPSRQHPTAAAEIVQQLKFCRDRAGCISGTGHSLEHVSCLPVPCA